MGAEVRVAQGGGRELCSVALGSCCTHCTRGKRRPGPSCFRAGQCIEAHGCASLTPALHPFPIPLSCVRHMDAREQAQPSSKHKAHTRVCVPACVRAGQDRNAQESTHSHRCTIDTLPRARTMCLRWARSAAPPPSSCPGPPTCCPRRPLVWSGLTGGCACRCCWRSAPPAPGRAGKGAGGRGVAAAGRSWRWGGDWWGKAAGRERWRIVGRATKPRQQAPRQATRTGPNEAMHCCTQAGGTLGRGHQAG